MLIVVHSKRTMVSTGRVLFTSSFCRGLTQAGYGSGVRHEQQTVEGPPGAGAHEG